MGEVIGRQDLTPKDLKSEAVFREVGSSAMKAPQLVENLVPDHMSDALGRRRAGQKFPLLVLSPLRINRPACRNLKPRRGPIQPAPAFYNSARPI